MQGIATTKMGKKNESGVVLARFAPNVPPRYFRPRGWEPAWCANCGMHYTAHTLREDKATGLVRGKPGRCLYVRVETAQRVGHSGEEGMKYAWRERAPSAKPAARDEAWDAYGRAAVTNTEDEARRNPLGLLVQAMEDRAPGDFILRQEAQGQRELARSETLPTEMSAEDRAALEKAGVVFEGPVANDKLFQHARLPSGWRIAPTDHSMWSNLVDANGRKRASVFYKAAFYDRAAHLHVVRRFSVRRAFFDDRRVVAAEVLDGDAVLFETPRVVVEGSEDSRDFWLRFEEARTKATQDATAWLDARYPKWRDANSYW